MLIRKVCFVLILLASLTLITSCGIFGSEEGLDLRTYDGIYALGPDISSFGPCNEDETWWVNPGETNLEERYQDLMSGANAVVFARLEGSPGPEGDYGPEGTFNREFVVEEIIELRYATSDDCI